jgi:glycosyltransferase involved in cell wall biosynthesis
MKIGIDARLYGPEHTGLGRYVTNLVDNVLKQDKENSYVLFVTKKHKDDFVTGDSLKVVVANVPVYTFAEQLLLPFIFGKEKLDLLHVPHFNAPLLYFGKLIITLHDLIKHSSKGPETTTRNYISNTLVRAAYYLETFLVVRKAIRILVPTNFVKSEAARILKIKPDKITVTYEASDNSLKKISLSTKEAKKVLHKYGLIQPFLIYTGNLYPHKNVDLLIEAVIEHNKNKEVDLCLAIVCARSVFLERAAKKIENYGAGDRVKLLGFVDDAELSTLYSLALALVHPSKMEGFGLTGLEAMHVGLPVISSNATTLPEVYGEACLYFDPNSLTSLVDAIEEIIKKPEVREKLSLLGPKQVKKYSWKKMAKETLDVYKTTEQK